MYGTCLCTYTRHTCVSQPSQAFPGPCTHLPLGSCQGLDSAHFLPLLPPPRSWGVGVPGNNGPPTPSGPLREKELPEGNITPRETGHRPHPPHLLQGSLEISGFSRAEPLSLLAHSVPSTWSGFPYPLFRGNPDPLPRGWAGPSCKSPGTCSLVRARGRGLTRAAFSECRRPVRGVRGLGLSRKGE